MKTKVRHATYTLVLSVHDARLLVEHFVRSGVLSNDLPFQLSLTPGPSHIVAELLADGLVDFVDSNMLMQHDPALGSDYQQETDGGWLALNDPIKVVALRAK